jgi:mannose-1-phosphate guanylyltransferase/mannose-6-phosphate isomerase
MPRLTPLIMCGGAGTRLWPASREGRPKQFLPLLGRYSPFQETVRRIAGSEMFDRPIVVSNRAYRFHVAEQLAEIDASADIILEPVRRDSGPAIAAGSFFAQRRSNDPIVVALAADHIFDNPDAFVSACATAADAASQGHLVTFGLRPSREATEYGYIKPGNALSNGVFLVDNFVEKPDEATAARYVKEGYLWNCGNFVFKASVLAEEYRRLEEPSAKAVEASLDRAGKDLDFITLDQDTFAQARAVSIDYAVLEKTKRTAVVPISVGWSDIGTWQTMWEVSDKDASDNATSDKAIFVQSRGSYVASDKALVALLGMQNVVVVATEDAILVADQRHTKDMKLLLERLRQEAPAVTREHLKVYRPWGSYQSVQQGDRYQVKRLVVKPKARLSLQMHHHRAEHWVVVRGTARVVIGDEVKILQENQSTYIPVGVQHRLENPGKIDLEVIEVQSGSYLGEDDIVRFDDDYRRPNGPDGS